MPSWEDVIRQLAGRVVRLEAERTALERRVAALEKAQRQAGFDPSGEADIDLPAAFTPDAVERDAPAPEEDTTPLVTENGDGTVTIKDPTPDQVLLREKLIPHIGFENWRQTEGWPPPLEPAEAEEAFVRGGPMWLYLYDRPFVMTLAPEVRRAFVLDIEASDPKAAAGVTYDLIGRDEESWNLGVAEDFAKAVWDG